MKNRTIKICFLFFLGFSQIALSENSQYVEIKYRLNFKQLGVEHLLNIQAKNEEFICGGDNYSIIGSGYSANGDVSLTISGNFKDDKRKTCKLGNNEVYFSLNTTVSFNYLGQDAECHVSGIGTSYDHMYREYDKLQSSNSGEWLECNDANMEFQYKVDAGQDYPLLGYNPGEVEIRKKSEI